MMTAVLVSCALLCLVEIIKCFFRHLLEAEDFYEGIVVAAWIGWFVWIFIACVKLAVWVNNTPMETQPW